MAWVRYGHCQTTSGRKGHRLVARPTPARWCKRGGAVNSLLSRSHHRADSGSVPSSSHPDAPARTGRADCPSTTHGFRIVRHCRFDGNLLGRGRTSQAARRRGRELRAMLLGVTAYSTTGQLQFSVVVVVEECLRFLHIEHPVNATPIQVNDSEPPSILRIRIPAGIDQYRSHPQCAAST